MSVLPRFEPSLDVKLICDLMLKVEVGSILTYESISKAIGRNIADYRYLVASALRNVQSSHQYVFSCVPKLGYKRLANNEIVSKGEQYIKHIRRTSNRGARTLACANYDTLEQPDKVAHNTRLTIFAMIRDHTSLHSIKNIEKLVSDSNTSLPAAKAAMELLKDIK